MTRCYCHFVTNPDTKIQKIKLFCAKTTPQNFWYDMKNFAIKKTYILHKTLIFNTLKTKAAAFFNNFPFRWHTDCHTQVVNFSKL